MTADERLNGKCYRCLIKKATRAVGADPYTLRWLCDECHAVEHPSSKQKLAQLHDMLHTDQTGLAAGLETVLKTVAGYRWVADGRGPYEWDDAQYRKEMGVMLDAIHKGAEQALARWKAGGIPRPCCKLCESPDETAPASNGVVAELESLAKAFEYNGNANRLKTCRNAIAEIERLTSELIDATALAQGYRNELDDIPADETTSPQLPIARVVIREDEPPGLQMYAPGLPPGAHELYCEPEAVAPYVRAEKAAESRHPCGCLVGTICPHRHAGSMCDGLITDPETGLKSVCPECYSKKANAHDSWCLCSDCLDKRGRQEAAEKTSPAHECEFIPFQNAPGYEMCPGCSAVRPASPRSGQ